MLGQVKLQSYRTLQLFDTQRFLKPVRLESAENLRQFFLELCGALKIKNLLEIGAHEASISIDFLLRDANGTRRALAFEANPFTFESKTKSASERGVEVFNFGVADIDSIKDFQIPINKDLGYVDLSPGNASFLIRNDISVQYEIVKVPTITLNEIFNTHNISGNFALWIDVEGFSKSVLMGADRVLSGSNAQLVFIEIESTNFWKEQSSLLEVMTLLSNYHFEWVAKDFEYRGQSNYIFIKTDSVPFLSKHIRKYSSKFYTLIIKSLLLYPRTIFQHLGGKRMKV